MTKKALYIGVMSGTSLDGIDTALVEVSDKEVKLLFGDSFPIPKEVKQAVLNMALGQSTNLIEVGQLDRILGHLYSDAVLQLLSRADVKASEIKAIGNHGQTVFHQPEGESPFTMQLGDANIISARTGITTVADFRRKDVALGGQGAPLVPAFHRTIFEPQGSGIVALNIGGIANISVLIPDMPMLGYDTGPGNMLLDAWYVKYQGPQTGLAHDKDGKFAASGKVNPALLTVLCDEEYFSLTAPKSTGRELFNLSWLMAKLDSFDTPFSPEDVQATLTEFTAITIANDVRKHQYGPHPELLVCGGGSKNPLLMSRLATLLADWKVCTTDEKGVSSDYMEAIAFAWLAYRRINDLPSNLPEVTGASRLASLGVVYPAD